jgi:hypothetical protein
MKKLIILLMIVPYVCMAQSSLRINYNQVYVGKNISVDFDYQFNKIILSIGANYYPGINKDKVAFHHFLKNRGTPSNIWQHFGLQLSTGYKIYDNKHFDLFGVYKGSIASMNSYFRGFTNYAPLVPDPQDEEDYALVINNHEFGPVFSFDNTLGLLLKCKITDNLFLNLHGGLGFTYVKNNDDFFIIPASFGSTLISNSFSIGLGYSFKNSKNNVK